MLIPFNCGSVRLTSCYGPRILDGKPEDHPGYDMVGVGSYDVVAVVGGTVMQSRIVTDRTNTTWQWGNYVCIRTEAGQYHYYCHLASRAVTKGQKVTAGTKLGVMGDTGNSRGAHLHFEVRAVDGQTKISPEVILGIPNKAGVYTQSSLERDLEILHRHGVVNTPSYWKQTAPRVQYLAELIHNMAEALTR